jgi:NTE family protein
MSFSGAMISTMRQIHDYDFLMRNPEYRLLICRIDADKDFNWLDFEMKQRETNKIIYTRIHESHRIFGMF